MAETIAILSDEPASLARPRGRAVVAGLIAAAAFVLLVVLTVLFAHRSARLDDDQNRFHLPTIRQFAAELPTPSIRDYRAATTPGYHLLLAIVARCGGGDLTALRIAGGVFGVLLVFAMAYSLHGIGGPMAAWLCVPLLSCMYVITSAGWLLPEDLAWLLALLLTVHALRAVIDVRFFLVAAIGLGALIFTRQSAVWAACPIVVAAVVGDGRASLQKRIAGAALALLPAVLILGLFLRAWHGLVPPAFQASANASEPWLTQYGGVSAGSVLMTLAMIGLFGTPLIGWFWRGRYRDLAIGAAIGLLVGVVLPSDAHFPDRRSGIWTLVQHLPTLGGRSPLMIALAMLGGAVVAIGLSAAPRRAAWVLGATLGGFVIVQMSNPFLWQRYYEPFALLWVALLAACSAAPRFTKARLAGVVIAAAWQLATLAYFVFFSAAE